MSYLEKLLNGVTVEWKPLGEVAKIQRGASPRPISKFITDNQNGVPWIKIGDTVPNSKYVSQTKQKITHEGAEKSRILKKGDLIMSNSMSFGRPYILNIDGAIHDGWASISNFEDVLNTDYVFHYLSSDIVQNYWLTKINSSSVSNLNADIIKALPIPIPCPDNPKKSLEIQQKIVGILDTFTELTAELTAELIARKKQYMYYREQLLSFEEGKVEWKTLGEVITFQRGKRLVKSQLEETGDFAVYQNSMTPLGYYHESNVKANTTYIICAGAAGEIGFSDVPFWAADDVYFCITPNNINNKYLYYNLQIQQHKISSQVRRASIPRLSKNVLENLKIPIPPLDEQTRIVSILDKFDILTNSISEGLPKEIKLRKEQYEYYRDLLLTFPLSESGFVG